MEELIYLVRKQAVIKVGGKYEAETIQLAAKEQGYNFQIKKQGWNWLVIDADV